MQTKYRGTEKFDYIKRNFFPGKRRDIGRKAITGTNNRGNRVLPNDMKDNETKETDAILAWPSDWVRSAATTDE